MRRGGKIGSIPTVKTRTWTVTGCFVAVMLVAANAAVVRSAAQSAGIPFDSISYHDSGGFAGGGTGKSLTVSRDGRIETLTRRGQRMVLQLGAEDLAALNTAVAAVEWPRVEQSYRLPGAADLVIRDLVVVVRGTTYETHADSLAKLPPPLRAVFDRLDDLCQRWR